MISDFPGGYHNQFLFPLLCLSNFLSMFLPIFWNAPYLFLFSTKFYCLCFVFFLYIVVSLSLFVCFNHCLFFVLVCIVLPLMLMSSKKLPMVHQPTISRLLHRYQSRRRQWKLQWLPHHHNRRLACWFPTTATQVRGSKVQLCHFIFNCSYSQSIISMYNDFTYWQLDQGIITPSVFHSIVSELRRSNGGPELQQRCYKYVPPKA